MASTDNKTYKFMANVFVSPNNRTYYVKWLEPILIGGQISIYRLLISTVIMLMTIIISTVLLSSSSMPLSYSWITIISLIIGASLITFVYIMPARSKSMLEAAYEYVVSSIIERNRLKRTKNGEIRSLGISNIRDDGIIEFDNGHVGKLFGVEGHLGLSTLPSVAEMVSNSRHTYLITRSSTSEEMLMTSITKLDLTHQLSYYQRIVTDAQVDKAKDDIEFNQHAWRAYMAALNHKYTSNNIHHYDSTIKQHILIREINEESLIKFEQRFRYSNNYLSAYIPIEKKEDIIATLRSITLFSGVNT